MTEETKITLEVGANAIIENKNISDDLLFQFIAIKFIIAARSIQMDFLQQANAKLIRVALLDEQMSLGEMIEMMKGAVRAMSFVNKSFNEIDDMLQKRGLPSIIDYSEEMLQRICELEPLMDVASKAATKEVIKERLNK